MLNLSGGVKTVKGAGMPAPDSWVERLTRTINNLKQKKMKTRVTNVLTGEEQVFINDDNTVENMVNFIICKTKTTGRLCDREYREKIRLEHNLFERTSRNGSDSVCFCETFDVIARQHI